MILESINKSPEVELCFKEERIRDWRTREIFCRCREEIQKKQFGYDIVIHSLISSLIVQMVRGYGYNVAELRRQIGHILGLDQHDKIIIIGAGNLGRAITVHIGFQKYGYELAGIFDSNISLENIEISGIKIMHTNRLAEFCKENHPKMAVLCIPKSGAKEMVQKLLDLGVNAFWNFSHYDIHYDHPEAAVENVHLTDSLMTLSYAARRQEEYSAEPSSEEENTEE